jgi:large subunit ribosomal protein L31
MKPEIHPQYKDVTVNCSCGHSFITRSTLSRDSLTLEVCAKCHPFYTGTQKIVDTAGRVERFQQKYGLKGKRQQQATAPEGKGKTK